MHNKKKYYTSIIATNINTNNNPCRMCHLQALPAFGVPGIILKGSNISESNSWHD